MSNKRQLQLSPSDKIVSSVSKKLQTMSEGGDKFTWLGLKKMLDDTLEDKLDKKLEEKLDCKLADVVKKVICLIT